jgi:hypothetical protein
MTDILDLEPSDRKAIADLCFKFHFNGSDVKSLLNKSVMNYLLISATDLKT